MKTNITCLKVSRAVQSNYLNIKMRTSIIPAIACTLLQILNCQCGTPFNRLSFFDIDLLRYTAEDKKGNIMISPASIKSTLAMILEGAKGATADEIKSALRVSPKDDDFRPEIKVFVKLLEDNNTAASVENANALFISNKLNLNKQYETLAQRFYGAVIEKLNFYDPKSSADKVNDWVKKKTHGLIPNIVEEDQITPSTEMMITNALYFKAPWKYGFNKRATYGDCFYNKGICRNVSMMVLQTELNYAYLENLRSHAIELPYQGDRYSMILLVPQDQHAEVTQIRDLPYIGLPQISDIMEPTDVVLTMPKFDVEYNDDMVGPLRNMRITTLFSQSANLSGIFGTGEYAHLNSIYHSVHMKVDEVGTIAAAASSSVVVPLINDQVRVHVDKPFLFFIRDNKLGVMLFEGKIEEPTEFVETILSKGNSPVPQQVAKQPSAIYHPQPSKNLTVYQGGPLQTNYNQSSSSQTSSQQGGFNQQTVQSNQQVSNQGNVYGFHNLQSSNPSSSGNPGTAQINYNQGTLSQSISYPGTFNQPTIQPNQLPLTNVYRYPNQPGLSSFSSTASPSTTSERHIWKGLFLDLWQKEVGDQKYRRGY